MATTAKKTSKKPVKKTAAKPAKTAKASVKKSVRKALSIQSLFQLNLFSAAVSALFAGLSAALLVPQTAQFLMTFMTRDEMASQGGVVLAPAVRVVTEWQLRYILCAIFAIGAIGSLLLATSLKKRFDAGVANANSGWRWLFVGLTSALLLEFVSILAGITDVATLKLIAGLILIGAFLGWASERQNQGPGSPQWSAYIAGLFTGVLAWTPLLISLVGTHVYGLERFGWHVYALAGVGLVACVAVAINLYRQIRGAKQWGNYLFVERNYLAVDVLVKVAVMGIILAALHK